MKGHIMNNNLNFRIVADSAADVTELKTVDFCAAPLKIRAGEREFYDTPSLDIAEMVDYLKAYKGKSTSSCPNPDEWLAAFGDAKYVFGVTLSSNISGSYNAAMIAKNIYETEYPERRVFIVDSLSAGPEETILVEKLEELITAGNDFDSICREITAYHKKTGVLFMLESLTNFANNGRVSHAVAKIAGLLGINIVGTASDEGTLAPTDKCRGLKKSIATIIRHLKSAGYTGGKLRIAHCFNPDGALALKNGIINTFKTAEIIISATGGLCSFYAERGGLLVGYET